MQERRIKLEQMLKTPGFANYKTSSEIFTACYFIESNKKICGQTKGKRYRNINN